MESSRVTPVFRQQQVSSSPSVVHLHYTILLRSVYPTAIYTCQYSSQRVILGWIVLTVRVVRRPLIGDSHLLDVAAVNVRLFYDVLSACP